MIEDVVNTIRDSIRRFNTEKDLYVSKLQEKIEELETVIKKCKEQKDKSEPLQNNPDLVFILDQVDKGVFIQLIRRLEADRPSDDKFLDDVC